MLKPYARSTITKKYRATGVPSDIISTVKDYIDACACFYYLLEMDEAKRIILKRVDISEDQFNLLLQEQRSHRTVILVERNVLGTGELRSVLLVNLIFG